MAASHQPIFLNSINYTGASFANADGTTAATIFTPTDDGGALNQINVTSTDTAAVIMQVNVDDGAVSRLLGSVIVPALSGTDGVLPSINILDSAFIKGLQNDGSLVVKSGDTVTVNPVAAVTLTFKVDVIPQGGDYADV